MTRKEIFERYAMSFLGIPYLWGGKNQFNGFDCSGFVCECLRGVGLLTSADELDAQQLYDKFFIKSSIPTGTGFLAFFGSDVKHINHVGIVLDPTSNLMIEAGGGGPMCTSVSISKTKPACVKIRSFSKAVAIVSI